MNRDLYRLLHYRGRLNPEAAYAGQFPFGCDGFAGDRTSARFYRVQAAGIGLGYLLGTGGTADDLAGLLNEARDLMPHRHQEAAS